MKLKYYLRGLGIGVIVTTLILMIAFTMHQTDGMTDEEIIARAKALGMVMQEKETPVKDTLANHAKPDEQTQSDQQEQVAEQSQKREEENHQEPSDQSQETAGEKTTIERVEISIVGGEYSDVISEKLEKAGLVDDAEAFNKYLAECGMDSFIQPGNYTLTVGTSYDEIIEEITKKD